MTPAAVLALVASLALSPACGSPSPGEDPASNGGEASAAGSGGQLGAAAPYATELVSFEPGEGAGYGEDSLPDVVLGPPRGLGSGAGSLHVLSLGKGGSIVLGFGTHVVRDGDGPDFVVFENAFWAGGDPLAVYAEPGEVSVSADGAQWKTFPCNSEGDENARYEGCAGWSPTLEYDAASLAELDPALTGGDAFDLAHVDLAEARYVRVRDRSLNGSAPTAGFDLDAIGVVTEAPVCP